MKYQEILFEERKEGREEGREEGEWKTLIRMVCRKLKKNKGVREITEELEENEDVIQRIVDVAAFFAPTYPEDEIFQRLQTINMTNSDSVV